MSAAYRYLDGTDVLGRLGGIVPLRRPRLIMMCAAVKPTARPPRMINARNCCHVTVSIHCWNAKFSSAIRSMSASACNLDALILPVVVHGGAERSIADGDTANGRPEDSPYLTPATGPAAAVNATPEATPATTVSPTLTPAICAVVMAR